MLKPDDTGVFRMHCDRCEQPIVSGADWFLLKRPAGNDVLCEGCGTDELATAERVDVDVFTALRSMVPDDVEVDEESFARAREKLEGR